MYCIDLSLEEIRLIGMAPEAVYQAARWIRHFHRSPYSHIGFTDHLPGTSVPDVLAKHGFVRVPQLELNMLRLLLESYGPLLIKGKLAHLAQNETALPVPERALMRVNSYEDGDHAVVLNGYWDGFEPWLLYRDPAHPQRQFAEESARLLGRREPGVGLFYQNCPGFPKPCPHLAKAAKPRAK